MPKATESIINFLTAKKLSGEHKGPDLIDQFLTWGCNMEVQVNVAAGKGEPVALKRSTYSDGIDTWFNFRIPKNAYDDPFFMDFSMKWPLDLHCEGIGSTGWDWKAKRSRWVGFDFDSILGHAEGVGVTSEELSRVREAARRCRMFKSVALPAALACISMCALRIIPPSTHRTITSTPLLPAPSSA